MNFLSHSRLFRILQDSFLSILSEHPSFLKIPVGLSLPPPFAGSAFAELLLSTGQNPVSLHHSFVNMHPFFPDPSGLHYNNPDNFLQILKYNHNFLFSYFPHWNIPRQKLYCKELLKYWLSKMLPIFSFAFFWIYHQFHYNVPVHTSTQHRIDNDPSDLVAYTSG